MRPGGDATSRMIDSAVTLLPQPDSPTSPSVVRGAMSNDTPSTARIVPSGVRNSVTRSRISSSGLDSAAGAAIRASLPAPGAVTKSTDRRHDRLARAHTGMRIIHALSLTIALLLPVAAYAAPTLHQLAGCCPCPDCPDCPHCPHK